MSVQLFISNVLTRKVVDMSVDFLDDLHGKSDDELFLIVGDALEREGFGVKPSSDEERRRSARAWFTQKHQVFQRVLCSDPRVRKQILEDPSASRNAVAALLFDILSNAAVLPLIGLSIGLPLGSLVVLLTRYSVSRLCDGFTPEDRA